MIKYIKKLFSTPENLEEQKNSDSKGYKIAAISFLITAILLILTAVIHWNLKGNAEERTLFYIILLNILGFAISADLSYRFSGQARCLKNFADLKKTKLTFYFVFTVVIGVPYLLMALWLFFNRDYFDSALLVSIFSGVMLVIYFYDWKKFIATSTR